MTEYEGYEKRECPRIDVNFIISYRIKEDIDNFDLSQSKDVSQGGMLLTTNKAFDKGTNLVMTIRFPFLTKKIEVLGEVVDSIVVVRNLIYNTRIKFFGLEELLTRELEDFILKYKKKQKIWKKK